MTQQRNVRLVECFGGGPKDGAFVPAHAPTLAMLDGETFYVYRLTREDDGTFFYLLDRTMPVAA
ncbi:MAG TPA: hypothetical protein VGI97_14675 [Gemmatimonadaceae bacterium]|jgi:hypothetical protein